MCQQHWSALRAAIDQRGLSAFVARDGAEAVRRLNAGDFDPLMGAHNEILARAMGIAGLELMRPNADGSERCPLCFLNEGCVARGCPTKCYDAWPGHAVDDQVAVARAQGLTIAPPDLV